MDEPNLSSAAENGSKMWSGEFALPVEVKSPSQPSTPTTPKQKWYARLLQMNMTYSNIKTQYSGKVSIFAMQNEVAHPFHIRIYSIRIKCIIKFVNLI